MLHAVCDDALRVDYCSMIAPEVLSDLHELVARSPAHCHCDLSRGHDALTATGTAQDGTLRHTAQAACLRDDLGHCGMDAVERFDGWLWGRLSHGQQTACDELGRKLTGFGG
jgi:hypothetical protein